MRSGKLQAADSLSRRIGELIARCNASFFPPSRELWCKIRKVTSEELGGDAAGTSNFTATMLSVTFFIFLMITIVHPHDLIKATLLHFYFTFN